MKLVIQFILAVIVVRFMLLQQMFSTDPYIPKFTHLSRVACNFQGSFLYYEAWHNDDGHKVGEIRIVVAIGLPASQRIQNGEE